MKLNEQLQLNEKLQILKQKLIRAQEENRKTKENLDFIFNEITKLESLIAVSPLGKFGSVNFGVISHDDDNVLIYYGGNMGDDDYSVDICLNILNWPSLRKLRTLSSFKEEGSADCFYKASFLINEYEQFYNLNNKQDKVLVKKG